MATYYFIRQGEVEDTLKIAELLLNNKEELIHKAVGSWLREAGRKDKSKLLKFLDKHAKEMPRTMLRYATMKLEESFRKKYMNKQ